MINVDLFTRSFQFATTVSPLGHLDVSYFVSCYKVKTLRNNLITLFQMIIFSSSVTKIKICLYSMNFQLLSLKYRFVHVFFESVLIECIVFYKIEFRQFWRTYMNHSKRTTSSTFKKSFLTRKNVRRSCNC